MAIRTALRPAIHPALRTSDDIRWGGAFSPLDLAPTAFYDFSVLTSLFQDAAGTVAVASDGDPVRRVNDLSGNGYTLTASSDAARPTYKTDGTRHWLEFNGIAHGLGSSLALTQPFALLVGINPTNTAISSFVYADNSPNSYIGVTDTEALRIYAGTTLTSAGTYTATDLVGVGVINGASSYLRANGTQSATANAGANAPNNLALGFNNGVVFYTGRIYWAMAFDTVPADFSKLEAWGASKAGATLA